jgi:hypothetical protein
MVDNDQKGHYSLRGGFFMGNIQKAQLGDWHISLLLNIVSLVVEARLENWSKK